MYTVAIDEGKRRVVTIWGPRVTDASLRGYQTSVWGDPGVHGFDEVIDFRGLEQIEVTTEGLEAVAHLSAGMDPEVGESRFAIVVNDNLSFGLSRMYEAFREMNETSSRQLMIFHDMGKALAWLDGEKNT